MDVDESYPEVPLPEILSTYEVTQNQLEIHEVALEVIAGHWGRGNDRKQRLEDAGYNVVEVNKEIYTIYNG